MATKPKTDKEDLWASIALYAGIDPETAKRAYYGLVKTIGKNLRAKEKAVLPDLGHFYLHHRMPHRVMSYQTKQIMMTDLTTQVKFAPNYKLKAHFHDFRGPLNNN